MARRSFGKYEVLARLATGGAASIFLARQPGAAGFNKLVVLKTLLPERACDADFVRMFLDEARLAARLHHPNCVQIYDLGRVEDVYYISMEYIFGETLWNLLTTVTRLKTPLPPTHVAAIIAYVCDGLHHAHELKDKTGKPLNLVHRDVSPQNIMISFAGQTKVVDFGIAKAETDRPPTVAGIVKGKFSYMSPEQITGNPVDRRSDIYSLGIVMFECLASRRLYRGDSPEDIARLILEHRAPRLRDVVPDVPQALDDICARALSRQPHRRFQSAQGMGAAIREYLEQARFNGNPAAISRLMADRFGDLVGTRRQAYEAAMTGEYDEPSLCEALGAQPVRHIDLYSEESLADLTAAVLEDVSREVSPAEAAQTRPDLDPAAEEVSRYLSGVGRRVELSTGGPVVSPVAVMPVQQLAAATASDRTWLDPAVEPADAPTRVEGGEDEAPWAAPDEGPEGWEGLRTVGLPDPQDLTATVHEDDPRRPPTSIDPQNRSGSGISPPAAVIPIREPDFDVSGVAHPPDPSLPPTSVVLPAPRWSSSSAGASDRWEPAVGPGAGPRAGEGDAALDPDPVFSSGGLATPSSSTRGPPPPPLTGSGAAVAPSGPEGFARPRPSSRPPALPSPLRRPSAVPGASTALRDSGVVVAPGGLGPLVGAPGRSRAVVVASDRAVGGEPTRPTTPVETPPPPPARRGYGLGALLAALGFGLAVGIVVGVAVARVVFVPLVPRSGVVLPAAEPDR